MRELLLAFEDPDRLDDLIDPDSFDRGADLTPRSSDREFELNNAFAVLRIGTAYGRSRGAEKKAKNGQI